VRKLPLKLYQKSSHLRRPRRRSIESQRTPTGPKAKQDRVCHSDFARFDIDVQGRRPDNKSRKHYDRNNGDESKIDKQIVFDHLSLLGFQK
jgi:hypothetical protein